MDQKIGNSIESCPINVKPPIGTLMEEIKFKTVEEKVFENQ